MLTPFWPYFHSLSILQGQMKYNTIHWIISARELCLDTASMSPFAQPFRGGWAAVLGNTVTSLSSVSTRHGDQCIIFSTLVHLHTKAFKSLGAMILYQWSCRQSGLLLMPLAPLSSAKTSQGVKGTTGATDETRLDSKERKWESTWG